jgi:hypothetical protein
MRTRHGGMAAKADRMVRALFKIGRWMSPASRKE